MGITPDGSGIMGSLEMPDFENASDLLLKQIKHISDIHKSISIKTLLDTGTMWQCVNKYIKEHNINLVVMGSHGTSGVKEYFMGSNTYEVIKQAYCPVLSIPSSFDEVAFNSILYPVRNVEGVVEKYDYVKPIVEKNNSALHILGVGNEKDMEGVFLLSKKVTSVMEAIDHSKSHVTCDVINCEDIAEKILEVAEKRKDDLLIINATLDKKWYQFFKGTYTQKIVNHSKIPVLSIKPELTPEVMKAVNERIISESSYFPLNLQPLMSRVVIY
jgi:nucleotide-binding universal stress UspA family protein